MENEYGTRNSDPTQRRDKFDTDWKTGLWLGHARDSNETLIGTPDGVVRAYAIKKYADGEQWSRTLVEQLQGTPGQPDPTKGGIRAPIVIKFDLPLTDKPQTANTEEPLPRRTMVTDTELQKYGYTARCPGCRARQLGLPAKKGHNEICRDRIEKLMLEDPDDRQKIENANARMAHYTARRIEEEEDKKRKVESNKEKQEAPRRDGSHAAVPPRAGGG